MHSDALGASVDPLGNSGSHGRNGLLIKSGMEINSHFIKYELLEDRSPKNTQNDNTNTKQSSKSMRIHLQRPEHRWHCDSAGRASGAGAIDSGGCGRKADLATELGGFRSSRRSKCTTLAHGGLSTRELSGRLLWAGNGRNRDCTAQGLLRRLFAGCVWTCLKDGKF